MNHFTNRFQSPGRALMWTLLFSFMFFLAPNVAAQDAPAQDAELERLAQQMEAITRELERLRLGGDVVVQADSGVLGFGPAASKIYKVDEGVSVGGYGEILYRMTDDELEDGTQSPADDVFDALRAGSLAQIGCGSRERDYLALKEACFFIVLGPDCLLVENLGLGSLDEEVNQGVDVCPDLKNCP